MSCFLWECLLWYTGSGRWGREWGRGGGVARLANIRGGHTKAEGGCDAIAFQQKQCRGWGVLFFHNDRQTLGVTLQGLRRRVFQTFLRGLKPDGYKHLSICAGGLISAGLFFCAVYDRAKNIVVCYSIRRDAPFFLHGVLF